MTPSNMQLPDYKALTPELEDYFHQVLSRPKVLETQKLGMKFNARDKIVTALDSVDLEVHRREFLCVIGPSGCGKSTLIRLVAGLEEPSSGKIIVENKEVFGPGPDRGMVFQSYTLFPWLTVHQNVMFGPKMQGRGGSEVEGEASQWLEIVGLARFADSYPHELSGGMRQRVAIARALANDPRILLMDEPFAALDAQTRASMQKHLLKIWENVDVTVLFVTHDLDEAVLLADRIIVLAANPGRIAEVIKNPVPRPRRKEQLLSPEFLSVKQRLEEWIHPEGEEEEELNIPFLRTVEK